jgi:hypothetical protein
MKETLFCLNGSAKNLLPAKHFPIIDRESFDSTGVGVPTSNVFDRTVFFATFA